ncbi:DUF6086 family protein [Kribbella sp. NPDC056861]|uniref:DUF6086 family protein n=1 Tax=Kribbella sp. NPDC056861 TaxID=3154857 RepID=UPI0034356FB9
MFVGQTRVFEEVTKRSSGLGDVLDDEVAIDGALFAEFVEALVDLHDGTNHPVLHSLLKGYIGTALVLAQRSAVLRVSKERLAAGGWLEYAEGLARSMPS